MSGRNQLITRGGHIASCLFFLGGGRSIFRKARVCGNQILGSIMNYEFSWFLSTWGFSLGQIARVRFVDKPNYLKPYACHMLAITGWIGCLYHMFHVFVIPLGRWCQWCHWPPVPSGTQRPIADDPNGKTSQGCEVWWKVDKELNCTHRPFICLSILYIYVCIYSLFMYYWLILFIGLGLVTLHFV